MKDWPDPCELANRERACMRTFSPPTRRVVGDRLLVIRTEIVEYPARVEFATILEHSQVDSDGYNECSFLGYSRRWPFRGDEGARLICANSVADQLSAMGVEITGR